jgi:hypothetical protein
MPLPPCATNRPSTTGRIALAAIVAVAAVVWLAILPGVADHPAMRANIERNDRLGIDPTAKFYTEVPGMADFREHVDSARRRSGAFGL